MPFKSKEKRKAWAKAWRTAHPECKRTVDARWRANNRAAIREYNREYLKQFVSPRFRRHKRRAANVRRWQALYRAAAKYGVTTEVLLKLYRASRARCAICARAIAIGAELCFDHDHKTGKLRECLCNRCNTGLGQFYEDTDRMQLAVEYLVKHKPKGPPPYKPKST